MIELGNGQKSTSADTASVGDSRPAAGFVLSLMAGVLILVGGLAMLDYPSRPSGGMMGGYSSMMGSYGGNMMSGYYGMMQSFGGWFYGFAIIGIIAGGLVLLSAIMVYDRPRQVATWGALILVFSVVSFFGSGGFFVGAVLGIIGGTLALTWR